MRNLDPTSGLYNGTRLMVMTMGRGVIKAKINTRDHRNQVVLIPPIALNVEDNICDWLILDFMWCYLQLGLFATFAVITFLIPATAVCCQVAVRPDNR
jgi:hypothetical protein